VSGTIEGIGSQQGSGEIFLLKIPPSFASGEFVFLLCPTSADGIYLTSTFPALLVTDNSHLRFILRRSRSVELGSTFSPLFVLS
jgi:hypothetical protein